MQFKIPQFLDIEDKIFGPFTFKQFSYLLASIAFAYIFWKLIPIKILAIPFIFIFSGTFLALAFIKINNRPFIDILQAGYKYMLNNKTYIWKKAEDAPELAKNNQDLRAVDILKKSLEVERGKNNKRTDLEKIKKLSAQLDILDENKKQNLNINLRDELLKKNRIYQGKNT